MLKQRHQFMVSLFAMTDAAAVGAVCVGAWWARGMRFEEGVSGMGLGGRGWVRGSLVLVVVPLVVLLLFTLGQYRPRRDKSLLGEFGQVVRASVLGVMVLIVGLWSLGAEAFTPTATVPGAGPLARWIGDPARYQLATLTLALPLALGTQRLVVRLALRWVRERGWNLRHVAIVGVGRLGQITGHTLARNSWTGLHVAYHVSHHPRSRRTEVQGRRVLGGLEDLERTLEDNPVDAVYLALPSAQAALVPELLRRLERFALDVRIVPDVHPRLLPASMTVHELEGMPILSYRECPTLGLGGLTKRGVDLVVGGLAVVCFLPLMALIALAVKLSDGGPVLFRQERVSLGGDTFRIYKFRTMRDAAGESAGAGWTSRGDPRITRLGRWLRRTSLDELPQLFNVLRGDMSLVGPRPERPELIARFREDWRGYMLRQHVKAGMTGWAQVHGLRGETSLRKRLQYDLHYIRHWSLAFDLRILVMTLFRGFVHPNAH